MTTTTANSATGVIESVSINSTKTGKTREPKRWQDTILVHYKNTTIGIPTTSGGKTTTKAKELRQVIKFRTRYTVFDGQFVIHCHFLDHEDEGMMRQIKVCDKESPSYSECITNTSYGLFGSGHSGH